MGLGSSKLEKALGDDFPTDERLYGLENFGNTCYCNSVLQALYGCRPFRERCVDYFVNKHGDGDSGDGSGGKRSYQLPPKDELDLLTALAQTFTQIEDQSKRTGVFAPKLFIRTLRRANEIFNNSHQQDAHEFLNFLLNEVADTRRREMERERSGDGGSGGESTSHGGGGGGVGGSGRPSTHGEAGSGGGAEDELPVQTWVHEIFGGVMTNATRCLCCETVTSRDEEFLDLSVEIDQNSSVSHCLRNFSSVETLDKTDKFFCDTCCSLQEAQKSIKVKRLPNVLALHLKRFKYFEDLQAFSKLSHRVVFPLTLRLPNTSDDAVNPERVYDLYAFVIHIGSGPGHGHYVAVIKVHGNWLLFDDDDVDLLEEFDIQSFYGYPTDVRGTTETGYLIFYQARDFEA